MPELALIQSSTHCSLSEWQDSADEGGPVLELLCWSSPGMEAVWREIVR